MRVIDVICFVPMYEFSPETSPAVLSIIYLSQGLA